MLFRSLYRARSITSNPMHCVGGVPLSGRIWREIFGGLHLRHGSSSSDWINRQKKDQYVKLAKQENYRARSAYKLLEINNRCKILAAGQTVVECGAAPGAWTQVATAVTGPKGLVVACDLLDIEPVNDAIVLPYTDFTERASQEKILHNLGERKIDLVLSDMAPNLSGNNDFDSEKTLNLVYSVVRFSLKHAAPGSALVAKVFNGSKLKQLVTDLSRFYGKLEHVKPASSRKQSSELYIVATDLKKIKRRVS